MSLIKYYELFSNKGDKRPGLFFKVLAEIYKNDKIYPTFHRLDDGSIFSGNKIPEEMQNGHYGIAEDDRCSKTSINTEWVTFFKDMYYYINSRIRLQPDTNFLNLIKDLSKIDIAGKSSEQLIKNLFFAFYIPYDKNGFEITSRLKLIDIDNYLARSLSSNDFLNKVFGAIPASSPRPTTNCISSFLDLRIDVAALIISDPTLGTSKTFSFKKAKLMSKWLFKSDEDEDKIDFFDEKTKKYFREGDYFAAYDDTGKKIIYTPDQFIQTHEEGKCESVGITTTGNGCTDYIEKCLEGSNIEECAQFFKDDQNFLQVKEEIEKLHPEIILKTIKGLNLIKEKVQVPFSKSKIYMLKEYSEWLCFIKDTLPVYDYKMIKDNQKLKKYVKTLISFVNANPVLLNPNFIDNRITKQIIIPTTFLKSGKLAQYGIEPNHSIVNGHHGLILSRNIGEFSRLIHDYHQRMFLDLGMTSNPAQMIIGMRGGAVNKYDEMQNNPMKRTYTMFFDYYTGLVKSLDVVGKQIDKKDSERIEGYLQKLKKSEEAVLKAVNVVGNYIKLYNIFGEDIDDSTLSLNKMQELVEERKTKVTSLTDKHNSLLSVYETLAKVVDDNLDSKL